MDDCGYDGTCILSSFQQQRGCKNVYCVAFNGYFRCKTTNCILGMQQRLKYLLLVMRLIYSAPYFTLVRHLLTLCFITARVAKLAKVMFSQVFVILSPNGGGGGHH